MYNTLRTILVVFLGAGISSGLNFLTQTYIGKNLTVQEYGSFSYQITILNLLAPCIGLGVSSFWLKAFGEREERAKLWMPATIKLIYITLSSVFLIILFFLMLGLFVNSYMFLVFSIYILGQSSVEFSSSMYQVKFQYLKFSLTQSVSHILRFFLIVLMVFFGHESFKNTIWIYAFVGAVVSIILFPKLKRFMCEEVKPPNKDSDYSVSGLLANSFPFFGTGFFYLIYLQSSVVFIKLYSDESEVAMYSAAFIFVSSAYIVPGLIYQRILLPKLHKWAYHDVRKIKASYKYGILGMSILGVIFSGVFFCFAKEFIMFFYNENYTDSINALKIMTGAILLKFMSASVGAILTTKNSIHSKLKILFCASFINVGLNLLLINYFGIYGAAVTTVLTELFMLLALLYSYNFKYKRELG